MKFGDKSGTVQKFPPAPSSGGAILKRDRENFAVEKLHWACWPNVVGLKLCAHTYSAHLQPEFRMRLVNLYVKGMCIALDAV